jgi:hypothetical protein
MVGCIFIFFLLAHSVITFAAHRFPAQLFMALPSCCPFGFPFGAPFRTECLTEYKLVPLLRSVLLLYGSFGLFSLPVPPDIFRNFRLHFLLVFNSTFK